MIRIALCLLVATAAFGLESNVQPLQASPECAGEIRLTFNRRQQQQQKLEHQVEEQDKADAQHVVRRSALQSVVGVSFQPSETQDGDQQQYKEFGGSDSTSGEVSAVIRGLEPGKKYQLRLRHGQCSDGKTQWEEYGDAVESTSGMTGSNDGPEGVGESRRSMCQSRRRTAGVSRPKSSRLHRATFASSGRRRRSYSPSYSYDSNPPICNTYIPGFYNTRYYYDTYTGCCYSYHDSYNSCASGFSVAGAAGGTVAGIIFIIAGIAICCRVCCYGPKGRYYNRRVNTTVITSTSTDTQPLVEAAVTQTAEVQHAQVVNAQPPPAQAAPGAYVPPPVGTKNGMAQATAPVAGQPPHAAAPYPAATPYPPATAPVQGVANPMFPAAGAAMAQAPPAYPEAPQQPAGNLAPAWGGLAPPEYTEANKM